MNFASSDFNALIIESALYFLSNLDAAITCPLYAPCSLLSFVQNLSGHLPLLKNSFRLSNINSAKKFAGVIYPSLYFDLKGVFSVH